VRVTFTDSVLIQGKYHY